MGGFKHKEKSPDSAIIVKLESPYDKNFILKTIRCFKNATKDHLKLNHIGFQSDANFFINENLTSHNYNIFTYALKYKKLNKLSTVFTRRGIVFVKIGTGDEAVAVKSTDELNEFFSS